MLQDFWYWREGQSLNFILLLRHVLKFKDRCMSCAAAGVEQKALASSFND